MTEFLRRLKDSGSDDIYVKYLHGVMNSEYEKSHFKSPKMGNRVVVRSRIDDRHRTSPAKHYEFWLQSRFAY